MKWTEGKIQRMRELAGLGYSSRYAAGQLGVGLNALRHAARAHGIVFPRGNAAVDHAARRHGGAPDRAHEFLTDDAGPVRLDGVAVQGVGQAGDGARLPAQEWTAATITQARKLARDGATLQQAAAALGLKVETLRKRAARYGITFVRRSAHSGTTGLCLSNSSYQSRKTKA